MKIWLKLLLPNKEYHDRVKIRQSEQTFDFFAEAYLFPVDLLAAKDMRNGQLEKIEGSNIGGYSNRIRSGCARKMPNL